MVISYRTAERCEAEAGQNRGHSRRWPPSELACTTRSNRRGVRGDHGGPIAPTARRSTSKAGREDCAGSTGWGRGCPPIKDLNRRGGVLMCPWDRRGCSCSFQGGASEHGCWRQADRGGHFIRGPPGNCANGHADVRGCRSVGIALFHAIRFPSVIAEMSARDLSDGGMGGDYSVCSLCSAMGFERLQSAGRTEDSR